MGQAAEIGYFSLDEIRAARGPLGLAVERDLWFQPAPLRALLEQHRDADPGLPAAVSLDDAPVSVSPETLEMPETAQPEARTETPADTPTTPTREALLDGLPLSTFKGHTLLQLDEGFSFGAAKAAAVVEHLDAIRAFVENHPVKPGTRLHGCAVSRYRNSPVLNVALPAVGRITMKPFSFGIRKARALLDHVEWVVRFAVAEEGAGKRAGADRLGRATRRVARARTARTGAAVRTGAPPLRRKRRGGGGESRTWPVRWSSATRSPARSNRSSGDRKRRRQRPNRRLRATRFSPTPAPTAWSCSRTPRPTAGGIDREIVWRASDGAAERITRPLDATTLAEAVRDGALRCEHADPFCAGGRAHRPRAAGLRHRGDDCRRRRERRGGCWSTPTPMRRGELRDQQGRVVATPAPAPGAGAGQAPKSRLMFGDKSALVGRRNGATDRAEGAQAGECAGAVVAVRRCARRRGCSAGRRSDAARAVRLRKREGSRKAVLLFWPSGA
ncbi:MAG: DUF2958 domain-containing protein [Anaerolineae bacterium]|nr:DUF2958 domain-containing protein [Anaerolineae bacterium]